MKEFAEAVINMDRRIIFVLIAIVILFPIIVPLNLPRIRITDTVKGVYDEVEKLKEGDILYVSFDFDPASKPELYPSGVAVCRHAFSKNIRVMATCLWGTGVGLANEILEKTAKEYKKEYGKDFVFLGWYPAWMPMMTGIINNFYTFFPKDYKGLDTRSHPLMKNIQSLKDVNYMVVLSAGVPGPEEWITYATSKTQNVKLGVACTAVIEPGLRPYYSSGQITGIIGAMKGAAEYEKLIQKEGSALGGMDAISLAHFMVIFLVVGGNILMFAAKDK